MLILKSLSFRIIELFYQKPIVLFKNGKEQIFCLVVTFTIYFTIIFCPRRFESATGPLQQSISYIFQVIYLNGAIKDDHERRRRFETWFVFGGGGTKKIWIFSWNSTKKSDVTIISPCCKGTNYDDVFIKILKLLNYQYTGVLRENPQGGGFFFHFLNEASSKKNPTPLGVFPNPIRKVINNEIWRVGFFFITSTIFRKPG